MITKLCKILISCLLFLSISLFVQAKTTTNNPPIVKLFKQIPDDFRLFSIHTGDLNSDGINDVVFMVKETSKEGWQKSQHDEWVDKNRRGIMIFLSQQKKKNNINYKLAMKKLTCFTSENEDGGVYFPPDLLLEIKKGKLIAHYGHGRYGWWRYVFRVNHTQNDFDLIGYDSSDNYGPVPQRIVSINFLTQKIKVLTNKNKHAEPKDDHKFDEKWLSITPSKHMKLSEIDKFEALALESLSYPDSQK